MTEPLFPLALSLESVAYLRSVGAEELANFEKHLARTEFLGVCSICLAHKVCGKRTTAKEALVLLRGGQKCSTT